MSYAVSRAFAYVKRIRVVSSVTILCLFVPAEAVLLWRVQGAKERKHGGEENTGMV